LAWGNWEDLGGPPPSGVCLYGVSAAGAVERLWIAVFAVGSDSGLYRRTWQEDGGWGGWESLGGFCTSAPAAVSVNGMDPDVFVRDENSEIRHLDPFGSWAGGAAEADDVPAVVSWGGQRLDSFGFVKPDSNQLGPGLYHSWSDGNHGGSGNLVQSAGWLIATPAASSWGPNRLDVFAIWNRSMEHMWWDGSSFRSGDSLGGSCIRGAAAVSPAVNLIHCFTIGSDSFLYENIWFNRRWNGWNRHDGLTCISAPAAISVGPHLGVFVIGSDSHLYHRPWNSQVTRGQPGSH
jgi:hypothetical protein